MVGDVVRDPISGEEFVVIWDGARRAMLLDYDTRWTKQRSDSRDRLTSGATSTIDLRRQGYVHKGSV